MRAHLVVLVSFGLTACGPLGGPKDGESIGRVGDELTPEDEAQGKATIAELSGTATDTFGAAPASGAPCVAHVDAANDDAANLTKYWTYRTRLRNEFVKVSAGDEPGTNLPAGNRQGGTLAWGDTTIVHAQYLGMLATELALLEGRQPELAKTTALELYYALRALDRLDRVAESHFRSDRTTAAGDLNGFFIRDDVPGDFLDRFPMQGATGIASEITTPFPDATKPEYHATEMSQDQVWHLTVGLALVKKLGDYTVNANGTNVNLRAYAKEITDRILRYMRNHDRWRTQNPIFDRDVLRGAEMDARRVFSYGFAEAGDWILGQDTPFDRSYGELHDFASRFAKPIFKLASVVESDNYHQRALATVGDINYATGFFDFGNTLWKLEHEMLSRKLFRYEHFPLIFVQLHGGQTRIDPTIYGGLLNAAPASGPFNHGEEARSCAWSSVSRLVWPESNASDEAWQQGDYDGLDYLLLHNLYQLTYSDQAKLDGLYR